MAETPFPAVTGYEYTENHRISVCRRKKSVKKHRFWLQIVRQEAGINDSCGKSRDGKQDSMILTANRPSGRENRANLASCRFTVDKKRSFLFVVILNGLFFTFLLKYKEDNHPSTIFSPMY